MTVATCTSSVLPLDTLCTPAVHLGYRDGPDDLPQGR
nr:MAG TPA: hypothetical protein [Caudoviricetes sp.]